MKILLIVFLGQSWSLRSTEFEAYTDPDFEGYQFKKVMLVVESAIGNQDHNRAAD